MVSPATQQASTSVTQPSIGSVTVPSAFVPPAPQAPGLNTAPGTAPLTVPSGSPQSAPGLAQAPATPTASAGAPAAGTPASCLAPGRDWPAERISAFLANPPALLTQYALGGGGLSGEVRAMVATSSATLEAVMSIVASASPNQRIAIASGLASAALACVQVRPDVAGAIQARVATIGDPEFLSAFVNTTGGTATAAFAGIGGGGGGGGGPAPALGTGFAPGSYGSGTAGSIETARSNLFNSVIGSSADSFTAARATNLASGSASVSPTVP